jgi:hypothetical protein
VWGFRIEEPKVLGTSVKLKLGQADRTARAGGLSAATVGIVETSHPAARATFGAGLHYDTHGYSSSFGLTRLKRLKNPWCHQSGFKSFWVYLGALYKKAYVLVSSNDPRAERVAR